MSMIYVAGLSALLLLLSIATACGPAQPTATPGAAAQKDAAAAGSKLPDQLFAAHYVDSYPNHGDVFAQPPTQVQIDFNFTLHEVSSIVITVDGATVSTGGLTLGPRRLSMWVQPQGTPGDGLYLVKYNACWPDRSCHPGQFAFVVDSKTRTAYLDKTGAKEVSIDMRDIMFQPAAIVVSKGTTVTWTNRDAVTHFVNTDPHPSHNVLGELNSLDLAQGQSFGLTFNQPGEWGYHCSAHLPQGMVGRVIVQP